MRAFARRALLELLNVAAAVYRVGCAFKAEKNAQSASTSRKVWPKSSRERIFLTQDFQNFGAPRAQNLRALDQRAF